MTKSELVARVSVDTGLTRDKADKAVTATFNVIHDAILVGDGVVMPGIGSLKLGDRAAR